MDKKKRKVGPLVIVVIIILGFLGAFFLKTGVQIVKLQAEKEEAEARQEELLNEKENLTEELENINSDDYIERMARKDLKLIKNNELLFVLPEFVKSRTDEVNGSKLLENLIEGKSEDSSAGDEDTGSKDKSDAQASDEEDNSGEDSD